MRCTQSSNVQCVSSLAKAHCPSHACNMWGDCCIWRIRARSLTRRRTTDRRDSASESFFFAPRAHPDKINGLCLFYNCLRQWFVYKMSCCYCDSVWTSFSTMRRLHDFNGPATFITWKWQLAPWAVIQMRAASCHKWQPVHKRPYLLSAGKHARASLAGMNL